jgi:hypothetical protein
MIPTHVLMMNCDGCLEYIIKIPLYRLVVVVILMTSFLPKSVSSVNEPMKQGTEGLRPSTWCKQ